MFCRQGSLAAKGRKPLRLALWPRERTLQASCCVTVPGAGVPGVVGAGAEVLGAVGAGSLVAGVVGAGSVVVGVVGAGLLVVVVVGAGSVVVGVVGVGLLVVGVVGVVVGGGVVGVVAGGVGLETGRRLAAKYRVKKVLFELCATANEPAVKRARANVGSLRGMCSPSRLIF